MRGNVQETKEKKRKNKKKQKVIVVNELPLSAFETMEIPFFLHYCYEFPFERWHH